MGPRQWLTSAVAAGVLMAALIGLSSVCLQARQRPYEVPQIKFDAGQPVTPYFEGWVKNPDGTFDLVFGYFNRNWQQELAIPAGPDNLIEPGGPDRGQPTFFLTRRQERMFRVRVPADFGKQELVWTLTSNGRTERAYGNLDPVMELYEEHLMFGGFDPIYDDPNKPPTVTIAPVTGARAGTPVTLTMSVADDGLPAYIDSRRRSLRSGGRKAQLTGSWLQYGGPAKVTFDKDGSVPVTNGQLVTTARFPQPGKYTLVAFASDGQLISRAHVTIDVQLGSATN